MGKVNQYCYFMKFLEIMLYALFKQISAINNEIT